MSFPGTAELAQLGAFQVSVLVVAAAVTAAVGVAAIGSHLLFAHAGENQAGRGHRRSFSFWDIRATWQLWLSHLAQLAATDRDLVAASTLAAIIESSDEAIISKSPDGTITTWNGGARHMYGYTADQAIGQPVFMLVPAERVDELRTAMARVTRGERVDTFETQRVRKDGSTIDVSLTISPIRNGRGTVVGVSATARDITKLRLAAIERESLQERLNQSQRLDSLGQLASGIAHDFNNLLGTILIYAALVARETAGSEVVSSDAAQIQAAAEHGARLTRQLLLFARREPAYAEELEVNAVVSDMRSMLEPTLGERLQFVVRLAAGLPTIRANRGQMEQVVVNLVINARDAMPNGGTLTVVTDLIVLDDCAHDLGVSPGLFVELRVSDTGTGIDPGLVGRIFEPFFTTKLRGAGTGLGLSTIYGIVTGLGGSVTVSSQWGVGTTLRVVLPVVDPVVPSRTECRDTPVRSVAEVLRA